MTARQANWRKLGITLVKALFGLGVLAFVLSRLDVQHVFSGLASLALLPLALAVLAQVVGKVVWAMRWRQLLLANGIDRSLWELVGLIFIGLFFNTFLPTSVGGDLVRGYYIAREREGLTLNYAILLVERVLGLITLTAIAGLASLIALLVGGLALPDLLLIIVLVGSAAVVTIGILSFTWRGWRGLLEKWTTGRPRASRIASELTQAFDLFQRSGTRRVYVVVTSLLLQVIAVLFHVACARAVGIDTPTLVFFLIVPASVVASMLPVTLNGLGLREGVLVGLLVSYGSAANLAGAFALLALMIALAFSLMGGLVYPFYRPGDPESKSASVNT